MHVVVSPTSPSCYICLSKVVERDVLLLASGTGFSDSSRASYNCLNITVTFIINVFSEKLLST